jgi:hypothetical protein
MKMTFAEINSAIAEACGWTVQLSHLQSGLDVVRGRERRTLPNYCGDLNAMHEAERILQDPDMYAVQLAQVCGRKKYLFHATALQRAKAFLRTLGRWKE